VLLVGMIGGMVGLLLAKRLPAQRRGQLALLSIFVATGAWLADALAFPRLYPAFHLALLGILLIASAGFLLPLAHHNRAQHFVFLRQACRLLGIRAGGLRLRQFLARFIELRASGGRYARLESQSEQQQAEG